MVVAMTLTPALTLILLRNTPIERHESPVVRVLQRGYTALLTRVIRRPRWLYAPVILLTIIGVALVPTLGQSLFPHFKEPDFLIHWVTQPGTSDAEMERTTKEVSAALRKIPGVRNFGAHIGQAFLGEEVACVNLGENWVSVDPSVDYDETLDAIEHLTNDYPLVFGSDLSVLREKADEINHIMAGIEGTLDHHVDISSDVPQLQVQVDLQKAG